MSRTMVLTVVISLVLILAAFAGMARVLRRRMSSQGQVPDANRTPADLGQVLLSAEGEYVSSVRGGSRYERVEQLRLGMKSAAALTLHEQGVLLEREGSETLFIPAADLIGAERTSGQIGKFVEHEGLLALTWLLEEEPVTTAFRARYGEETQRLLHGLDQIRQSAVPSHS